MTDKITLKTGENTFIWPMDWRSISSIEISTQSVQCISAGGLYAWCGDLGIPSVKALNINPGDAVTITVSENLDVIYDQSSDTFVIQPGTGEGFNLPVPLPIIAAVAAVVVILVFVAKK